MLRPFPESDKLGVFCLFVFFLPMKNFIKYFNVRISILTTRKKMKKNAQNDGKFNVPEFTVSKLYIAMNFILIEYIGPGLGSLLNGRIDLSIEQKYFLFKIPLTIILLFIGSSFLINTFIRKDNPIIE